MAIHGFVDQNGVVQKYDYKSLENVPENLESIPYSVKMAMDTLFAKAAYSDDDAASSYATFHTWAMENTVVSITAVFTQGSAVIYDTDSLDTLKQYLTVTANYSDGTSEVVTDYTLSGTLTERTSTITVSYYGKTTTFNANVTHYPYEIATMNDVESSIGIAGLSCNSGSYSYTSAETYSAVVLSQSVKGVKANFLNQNGKEFIVFAKQSNGDLYAIDRLKNIFIFTPSGNKYTATKDLSIATITGDFPTMYDTFEILVENGVMTITGTALDGSVQTMTITNANRIGFWAFSTVNNVFKNTEVMKV